MSHKRAVNKWGLCIHCHQPLIRGELCPCHHKPVITSLLARPDAKHHREIVAMKLGELYWLRQDSLLTKWQSIDFDPTAIPRGLQVAECIRSKHRPNHHLRPARLDLRTYIPEPPPAIPTWLASVLSHA